jgi:hypothetical protein
VCVPFYTFLHSCTGDCWVGLFFFRMPQALVVSRVFPRSPCPATSQIPRPVCIVHGSMVLVVYSPCANACMHYSITLLSAPFEKWIL